jgi:apolipoprotein N-acyltransferase
MAEARHTISVGRVGIDSPWLHLLLLALTGVLLGLSFPQPGWGVLAHVALVPATILALRCARWRRLAWSAMLVFSLWWLIQIRWMIPVTAGGYAALSVIMACYFTAALLTARVLDRRLNMPMVIALPLAWVSWEYLRCTVPQGGFAWFALGHSQAPHSDGDAAGRLVQIADMFGQWGVSFLVAMTNGLIVDFMLRPLVKANAAGVRRTSRTIRGGLVLWMVAILAAWGYGSFRLQQADKTTSPGPVIAVIQTHVPQDNKVFPTPEQVADDWQRMVLLTYEAAGEAMRQKQKPHLLVWPETMVPVALNDEALRHYEQLGTGSHEFAPAISRIARDLSANLLVGAHANRDWRTVSLPNGRQVQLPAERYNSVYHFTPDGVRQPHRYDKIHRVPFGEYVPWVDHWPWLKRHFIRLLTPYSMDYSLREGQSYTVFELPNPDDPRGALAPPWRAVTPICFEDADPAVTRKLIFSDGGKRADVLVNVTNDGWFAGTDQPWQHLQIAVLRSVENRVPTARSVNTGVSGFIDSSGRIGPLMRRNGSATQIDGSAYTQVKLDSRVTLFSQLGNGPVVVMTGLTLALAALGLVRQRARAGRSGGGPS